MYSEELRKTEINERIIECNRLLYAAKANEIKKTESGKRHFNDNYQYKSGTFLVTSGRKVTMMIILIYYAYFSYS